MVVHVRLFAMLRERAGSGSVEVTLGDGATVRDALDEVGRTHGLAELIDRMPVVAALNREYVSDETALSPGDELALIPPVSGGETDAALNQYFRSGDGYDRFMELVGNYVERPPAYAELLGMRPLHTEPGHMRFEFRATEQLLNPAGMVQGGFVTAMLDETMGPALLSALGPGHVIPTLELKVNFLRPVRPGRLVADGRVVHRGKSVAFMESSLTDDEGKLMATATATARIVALDGNAR
jgi:molybdopterin converting factor subunit 1